MTASFDPEPNAASEGDETQRQPIAGRLLREARLKAGMHLAVLSVTLKVPIRELEALEADEWDPVKGPVFYRGLASSICRHLRIDADEILALMPPAAGQLEPVRAISGAGSLSRKISLDSEFLAKPTANKVVWTSALMLVLIVALVWMPSPHQWSWLDSIKAVWASNEALEQGPLVAESARHSEPDGLDNGLTATDVAIPLSALPVEVNPAIGSDVPMAADSSTSPPAQDLAAPSPVASTNIAASEAVPEWVFTASDDSWLEVRNAQQAIVWSGILKPGQNTRIQSPLPVSVVVGRAQVVTVRFRDQAFDLKPHTKAAVARFEVKE